MREELDATIQRQTLARDAEARIRARLENAFPSGARELMTELLAFNPEARPTAAEAKKRSAGQITEWLQTPAVPVEHADDAIVRYIASYLRGVAEGTVGMSPRQWAPERQREWCQAALARLCYGAVHGVTWGLQRMKAAEAQAAEAIAQLRAYLQRHQERVDYRFARQGGYPMGRGGIKSANTCICPVRLKRSGAWWGGDQRPPETGPALRQIQRYL